MLSGTTSSEIHHAGVLEGDYLNDKLVVFVYENRRARATMEDNLLPLVFSFLLCLYRAR